jgi:hypothetical protein
VPLHEGRTEPAGVVVVDHAAAGTVAVADQEGGLVRMTSTRLAGRAFSRWARCRRVVLTSTGEGLDARIIRLGV